MLWKTAKSPDTFWIAFQVSLLWSASKTPLLFISRLVYLHREWRGWNHLGWFRGDFLKVFCSHVCLFSNQPFPDFEKHFKQLNCFWNNFLIIIIGMYAKELCAQTTLFASTFLFVICCMTCPSNLWLTWKWQRFWDWTQDTCGQHKMCTINNLAAPTLLFVWVGRERVTHTDEGSSYASVWSQSAGTIGSIVQLAGPCVPALPPYLSSETGVFLLVTHSPAALMAPSTVLSAKTAVTQSEKYLNYKINSLCIFFKVGFLFALCNFCKIVKQTKNSFRF